MINSLHIFQLEQDDDPKPGVLTKIRAQICSNVALYVEKYEEEFESNLNKFVTAIWNLLLSTTDAERYDVVSIIFDLYSLYIRI